MTSDLEHLIGVVGTLRVPDSWAWADWASDASEYRLAVSESTSDDVELSFSFLRENALLNGIFSWTTGNNSYLITLLIQTVRLNYLSIYLPILHKTSQLSIVVHSCCARVPGTTEFTESKLIETSVSSITQTLGFFFLSLPASPAEDCWLPPLLQTLTMLSDDIWRRIRSESPPSNTS